MKKYDLLRSGDSIIWVLEIQGDRILVIDCIKRTMPRWMEKVELESYSVVTNDELSESTGIVMVDVDTLGPDQGKTTYERYTMIAPILSFISDDILTSLPNLSGNGPARSRLTVKFWTRLTLGWMPT